MKRAKTSKTMTTTEPSGIAPLENVGDVGVDLLVSEPQAYVPTGIKPLDDIIIGIVAGEATLIAGPPGHGKTALSMQILYDAALSGVKAAILSMEMGKRALAQRLISTLSGVPTEVLRKRNWSKAQKAAAEKAATQLRDVPLFAYAAAGATPDQAGEIIRSWKEQGVGIVAVDYLQQMRSDNESRQVQVGEAARAVKGAAAEADMPLIVISSLNRASVARGADAEPRLSDLRDSGELEYVFDTILMFHYPSDDAKEDIRSADIHVMKQRNGPTGIASVIFNRPKTRFEAT